MEGINSFFPEKDKYQDAFLFEAYGMIHGTVPTGLEDWEIAKRIVEVLGDSKWVPIEVARECVYRIVHKVVYPDEKTREGVVLMAEEVARTVFPELEHIDEVHMDQIEYVYNKWKND